MGMTEVPSARAMSAPRRAAVLGEPAARVWLLPFLWAGMACIVGGGLLAAATAYVSTEKTAWATAYLVLVGGVAQVALGAAVTWLRPNARPGWGRIAFAAWNLGNAGVLAGQLATLVVLTDVGSALLVVALVLVLASTARRPAARGSASYRPDPAHLVPRHPLVLGAFRVLLVILGLGIVVGTTLAHLSS